jgi:tetratricopeptide (TPR) repeat protein
MWLMDSLAELFSFSLAKRKASEDAFWIHPVVQNWARERLESQSKQKKAEEAVVLCGRIYRQREDKQRDNWTFERRILPHITSVQRGLKALLKTSNTGTFVNGEILFQGAANVAEICLQHGLYSDAEYLLEWALDRQTKLLGYEHTSTLSTMNSLAVVFDNQGQHEMALDCYGRAFDGYEKTLGKDHPATLDTVNSMALVFDNQGQYEKALEWYGRALDGKEKRLGKDHPSTLRTLRSFKHAQAKLR